MNSVDVIFSIRRSDKSWALIGIYELGYDSHLFEDVEFMSKLALIHILRHVGRYECWESSSHKELPGILRTLHGQVG